MAGKNVGAPHRTSPPVRVSFPTIFTPKPFQAGDTPKYSIVVMLDKADKDHMAFVKQIHADLKYCLETQWPKEADRPRVPLVGETYSPIKDGDKTKNKNGIPLVEKNAEYANHYIIRAATANKPVCVDKNMSEILDTNVIYGGCYCKINLNAYAYASGSGGVTFGLNGVQFTADGDSFGGGRPPTSEMFDDAGADDPSNYGSDDPFAGTSNVQEEDTPF